jgi:hypothetical protein
VKRPIVVPELGFHQQRFPVDTTDWESWQEQLQTLGIEVHVKSRQYLENCESQTTDLIAAEGTLSFLGSTFSFTAQIDFEGFALYVGDLSTATSAARQLSSHLQQLYPQSE